MLQVRESVWGGEQESSSEEGGGGEGIWDTQAMEVKGQLISAPGENKRWDVVMLHSRVCLLAVSYVCVLLACCRPSHLPRQEAERANGGATGEEAESPGAA